VIADPGSAALLNLAGLGIPICLRDDLSCGPVLDFSDANRWSLRQQFWGELAERGPRDVKDDFEELLKSEDALRSCSTIRLWVGSSVQEHLTLLWSVAALTHLQVDLSKLDMVYLDHDPANGRRVPFLHVVSEKGYRIAANMALPVTDSLLRECQQAWQAVTQPTPAGLQSLPRGGSVDASVILSRVRYLRFLYPSISTGLNITDTELLARCKSRGPKESRILGEYLGAQWETIMDSGDVIVSWRISRLASPQLARPLLHLEPDTTSANRHMRVVSLTEFGEAVLAGQANHLLVNGIDDWVGGVHLSSRHSNVWCYDETNDLLVAGSGH
jgi:Domain of unknown function (DUF1835)